MPQAADITVNNGAGTPVAKTFTLLAPSASDGSAALWALKEGTISTVFPTIESSSRRNAGRDARKLNLTFKFPSSYTDTVTGLTAVSTAAVVNTTVTVPDNYPEALKNDLVAFTANLMNHALVKAMVRDALSAT